jgi:rod shape-determining protein MreC
MKGQRGRAIAVIVVLALILAWLVLDQAGGVNPVRDGFSRLLAPVQLVLGRLVRPVSDLWQSAGHWFSLQKDYEALRQENLALRNQVILLQEAQIENENLRRQLNYKSAVPALELLAAEVIGHDPNNLLRYLIIDRGAADGVQRGMPVLTAEGLVGRISEVSASAAKVMLITDPSSSVSALIQRSRATGMVQGYPGGELVMRYIPQGDMVAPGDIVLTSGLGGNFPKRLVIGQVASVSQRDVEMFQEAVVIPAVNLRDLEMVMVVLNFAPTGLAQEGGEP